MSFKYKLKLTAVIVLFEKVLSRWKRWLINLTCRRKGWSKNNGKRQRKYYGNIGRIIWGDHNRKSKVRTSSMINSRGKENEKEKRRRRRRRRKIWRRKKEKTIKIWCVPAEEVNIRCKKLNEISELKNNKWEICNVKNLQSMIQGCPFPFERYQHCEE